MWLEGDNSLQSIDSRKYGPIPQQMIKSRVLFRVCTSNSNDCNNNKAEHLATMIYIIYITLKHSSTSIFLGMAATVTN